MIASLIARERALSSAECVSIPMQTDAKTWNYCELICIKFKFLTRICISNNWNYIQRKYIPQCWKRQKSLAPSTPVALWDYCNFAECRQMSDGLQCYLQSCQLLQICKWQLQLNPDCLLSVYSCLTLEFYLLNFWIKALSYKEQKHILVRSPLSRIKYLKNWFQLYWLF